MELILQVFYSVLSGALLAAAIPNELYLLGCPFFTLFAFISYYLLFNHIKNFKQAFLAGFLQAVTTHFISSFWLVYFEKYAVITLGASAFGTGCIGGFFGLFFYLPYSSTKAQNKLNEKSLSLKFPDSTGFRIIYFAALYTLYEWVKSSGFFGYPWGTVTSALYRWPILTQLAAITGTYGITFVILIINAILAELIIYTYNIYQQTENRWFNICQLSKVFSIFMVIILLYGTYNYNITRKIRKTLTTVLIQQNSDPWKEKTDNNSIIVSENLTNEALNKLKEEEKEADLIVWSEGCLKRIFPDSVFHYTLFPEENPLIPFIDKTNKPFIIGGSFVRDREHKKYFNSANLFDANGEFRGCYGKNHLVPFAEALPFIEYPKIKAFVAKVIGISAAWTPGDQYVYFDVPCQKGPDYQYPTIANINLTQTYKQQKKAEANALTAKIATPICFDDSFTDIIRPLFLNGAELLINITDDSWSLTKSSEYQHFVIASYRAIEYRTTLVRSTNAGYSVVLDPAGKILHDMPLFEAAYSTYTIPIYDRKMTTYARFGNWLPYTLLILFSLYCIYSYLTFSPDDYIPSERKIKKAKKDKKKDKKNSKKKK